VNQYAQDETDRAKKTNERTRKRKLGGRKKKEGLGDGVPGDLAEKEITQAPAGDPTTRDQGRGPDETVIALGGRNAGRPSKTWKKKTEKPRPQNGLGNPEERHTGDVKGTQPGLPPDPWAILNTETTKQGNTPRQRAKREPKWEVQIWARKSARHSLLTPQEKTEKRGSLAAGPPITGHLTQSEKEKETNRPRGESPQRREILTENPSSFKKKKQPREEKERKRKSVKEKLGLGENEERNKESAQKVCTVRLWPEKNWLGGGGTQRAPPNKTSFVSNVPLHHGTRT